MTQIKKISLALLSAGLLGAGGAHAVDITSDDWKLSIDGNVNGFLTSNSNQGNPSTVVYGLAGAGNNNIGIQNGLLPNELSFGFSTRQENLDINAVISLWPTIDTTQAGQTGTGAGTSGTGLNSRQGYFTFGDKSWGTVKIGRDLGLFGSDAILSDMTLLSVGAGSGGFGGPTTLGRIGAGYLYADWIPQITYSTPDYSGLTAAIGLFQGLDNLTTSGYQGTKQPGVQGKVDYAFKGTGFDGKVWAGFLTQQFDDAVGSTLPTYSANAYEIGGKVGVSGFEFTGYYYSGKGVGTTLLFLGGDDGAGNSRKSDGGYLQGTYKIGKVKLGLSYGQSKLKAANGADATSTQGTTVAGALLDTNASSIASLYYSLTKSVTLVAEYIDTTSKNQIGQKNTQDTVALGGIVFF